jgi:shikimate kinase
MQNETIQSPDNNRKYLSGNLILIGMMGSGKTTIGRSLSHHLGKTFVDCDHEIQKRTGVSIPHIFEVEGEAGFRLRETTALKHLVKNNNQVLATGGGTVMTAENREFLPQNGIVIYLKADVHDLWLRTRHDRNRPLLRTTDPYAKLTELNKLRDPLYQQIADIVLITSKQSAHSLMLHLVHELNKITQTS